ncbi:MAG TPA: NAD(P)-dependent alcohol dehydrogenase [Bryobacteraceae bacterium]|nr:NAD(P)-dependent alcohol dehydrogenase [Bryobacteraceae bacterium]
MKAWRFSTAFGLENLESIELPDPVPGLGQAVVRVRACSLNYRDLVVSRAGYGKAVKPPLIPLSDGAGEVMAIGEGVTRVKPGDRVAAIFMQGWIDGPPDDAGAATALGGSINGMLAEQVCLNAEGLVHFPDHLIFEEAASLPCAAVTAWHSLFDSGGLRPGQTVLVLGSGGVSVFALQFAKQAGARVIATTSGRDGKEDRLRSLGADAVINYRTTPGWDRAARDFTDGAGVDHVLEVGGAGTLPLSLKSIRRGGHIAVIGVLAGGGEIDPRFLFIKQARVHGIYVGSRRMFEDMNRAIAASRMRPVVDRIFDFDDVRAAYEYLESGAHFGKVCIRV